jgi:hypothetical protein
MYRKILLKIVKGIIRKHFSEGLSPIYGGLNSVWSKAPIAWNSK